MKKTKVLALYLPQYYETEYNNEWWGKGYTEWIACKQAKPLFKEHNQPRLPLNNHFYDLSDKSEISYQCKIAKEYGIDGFVIYQYYSCNNSMYGKKNGKHGSMLLNVPTEIIRDNEDIDIDYCLYWANHDWRKSWFGQDKTMLWTQVYGTEDDWREYYEYNRTYFKDKRYIKIENKPLFLIFAIWHFKEIDNFMKCWNQWAKEDGFNGIYFIKTDDAHTRSGLQGFNATYRREPFYTFANGFSSISFLKRGVQRKCLPILNRILAPFNKGIISYRCDYEKLWRSIATCEGINQFTIPGAVADWDNTARNGYNGQILTDVTVEIFENYFKKLILNCKNNNVPFIIINAWNEWAEGAYLEPDEKRSYDFLNAIKNVISE